MYVFLIGNKNSIEVNIISTEALGDTVNIISTKALSDLIVAFLRKF